MTYNKNLKKKSRLQTRQKISFRRNMLLLFRRSIFVLKILLLLSLIILSFTNYFDHYTKSIRDKFYLQTSQYGFTLKEISVLGRKNTSEYSIEQALRAKIGDPILAINLKRVKERLEQIIWVKNAVVERRLPTTIYIQITENEPFAIWQFQQELYLIDQDGKKITKYQSEFADLLQVVGEDANIYTKQLKELLAIYPELAKQIESAVRYGRRRWNLNLRQGIMVKMPEKDFASAYEYLNNLYKKHELSDRPYKMLDLRDSEKYYVE